MEKIKFSCEDCSLPRIYGAMGYTPMMTGFCETGCAIFKRLECLPEGPYLKTGIAAIITQIKLFCLLIMKKLSPTLLYQSYKSKEGGVENLVALGPSSLLKD